MHQTTTETVLLTAREAAALLRVEPQTIRTWVRQGRLPGLRIGTLDIRIRRCDLDAFLERAASAPPPTIKRRNRA